MKDIFTEDYKSRVVNIFITYGEESWGAAEHN